MNNRTSLLFILLFFCTSIFAQTQQAKINYILDILGWTKAITAELNNSKDYYSQLKVNTADKRTIDSVIQKLRSEEISARLSKDFKRRFTPGEIDTLYLFLNSPTGKKFRKEEYLTFGEMNALFTEEYKTLKIIEERSKGSASKSPADFSLADREDGIYVVKQGLSEEHMKYDLEKTPVLKLDIFKDISTYRTSTYDMQIKIELTQSGQTQFYEISKKYIGKQLAIVASKTIIAAPVVNEAINSNELILSGSGDINEMSAIVQKIKEKISQ